IFASLKDKPDKPLGFALLDSDKALPIPSPTNPQTFITFVQLSCHETENLYLSDEVLTTLELDWAQAKEKIVAASPKYGNKEGLLARAAEWDRKTADLKAVINELGEILDDKHVHWTTRVGNCLGRETPGGQLADFLGQEVLAAIWGANQQQ